MEKGDKVIIKKCPIEKYIGETGIVSNIAYKWDEDVKLYKIKVGDKVIKDWATEDCIKLVQDELITENTKPKYKENEECYHCVNKYNIPGNAHIGCRKFCAGNKFNEYGIHMGWVINMVSFGISCFDPVWKETHCSFFKEKY